MGRMTQARTFKRDGSAYQTRTFVYNTLGQLTSATNPENGTVTYTYNGDGLLATKTDAKSQVLYFFYDTNHRLLRIESPQGTVKTEFTYDSGTYGIGKMTTASNDGHTWRYSYDIMGRVTTQTLQAPIWNGQNQLTATAQYGFDLDGQLKDLYYPGFGYAAPGGSVPVSTHYQYSYDAVGRPTGLQYDGGGWQTVAQNAQYNAAGQITSWQESAPGLTTLTRTYDPARGWITNINAGGFINLTYNYLPDGRVSSVTDAVNPGQSASYSYDELNRLTAATTPNWGLAFTYDDFGNRLTQSATGGLPPTKTLAYDNNNRITTSGYSYDSNGNLTNTPGSTTLQYDVFDRLTRGPLVGEYYPWYGYDAFGRRVWRSAEGGIQHVYFYDPGGRLLADLVVGGQATTYQYFAGQRIHQYTDRVGTVRYDRYVGARHYYPYGEEITSTNSDTYKFAELHRDSDTGLDYATFRYYSSGLGRFLTTDPLAASQRAESPQSWNRYAYVRGDPVNYIDPLGLLEASPGYCPPEYSDCGQWDWLRPGIPYPGGGGGGGGNSSQYRSVTPEQRQQYEQGILASLAAAWVAGESEEQGGQPYPKYLKVAEDYYTCFGKVVQRNISYDLYDSADHRLASGVITEHLFPTDYDAPIITKPKVNESSGKPFGTFNDTISIQWGPTRSYLQSFTVRGATAGLVGIVDIPVYVAGFGGEYGILNVTKTADYVEINGNRGTPKKCN